jgi:hypothetical protein
MLKLWLCAVISLTGCYGFGYNPFYKSPICTTCYTKHRPGWTDIYDKDGYVGSVRDDG